MKIIYRLAEIYLYLVCLLYIVVSLTTLYPTAVGFIDLVDIPIFGFIFLVVPIPLLLNGVFGESTELVLNYLAFISLFLAILGIISLILIRFSFKWIITWYLLSGLAIVTVLYNFIASPSDQKGNPLNFISLLNATLFVLATWLIDRSHKKIRQ